MNHLRIRHLPFVAYTLALTLIGGSVASAAQAGHEVWSGIVRHVSSENIKVYNPAQHKELSFLIVPRFGNVFKSDGQTPAQMKDLAAGQYVKVYYDQKFLGAYHADRILMLSQHNHVEGVNHS